MLGEKTEICIVMCLLQYNNNDSIYFLIFAFYIPNGISPVENYGDF